MQENSSRVRPIRLVLLSNDSSLGVFSIKNEKPTNSSRNNDEDDFIVGFLLESSAHCFTKFTQLRKLTKGVTKFAIGTDAEALSQLLLFRNKYVSKAGKLYWSSSRVNDDKNDKADDFVDLFTPLTHVTWEETTDANGNKCVESVDGFCSLNGGGDGKGKFEVTGRLLLPTLKINNSAESGGIVYRHRYFVRCFSLDSFDDFPGKEMELPKCFIENEDEEQIAWENGEIFSNYLKRMTVDYQAHSAAFVDFSSSSSLFVYSVVDYWCDEGKYTIFNNYENSNNKLATVFHQRQHLPATREALCVLETDGFFTIYTNTTSKEDAIVYHADAIPQRLEISPNVFLPLQSVCNHMLALKKKNNNNIPAQKQQQSSKQVNFERRTIEIAQEQIVPLIGRFTLYSNNQLVVHFNDRTVLKTAAAAAARGEGEEDGDENCFSSSVFEVLARNGETYVLNKSKPFEFGAYANLAYQFLEWCKMTKQQQLLQKTENYNRVEILEAAMKNITNTKALLEM